MIAQEGLRPIDEELCNRENQRTVTSRSNFPHYRRLLRKHSIFKKFNSATTCVETEGERFAFPMRVHFESDI